MPKSSRTSSKSRVIKSKGVASLWSRHPLRNFVTAVVISLLIVGTATAMVLAGRSQDIQPQAAGFNQVQVASEECSAKGMIFCGGCINDCRTYAKTCNQWIDDECKQEGCGGEGVFPAPGEMCCGGLVQCPNGRCGQSCGGTGDKDDAPSGPEVPKNIVCTSHADCASLLGYCRRQADGTGVCVGKKTSALKCGDARRIGGSANDECRSNKCLDGICVPSNALGICNLSGSAGDAQCDANMFCDGSGYCRSGRSIGSTCSRDRQCLIGLYCNPDTNKCDSYGECSKLRPCSDAQHVCYARWGGTTIYGACDYAVLANAPCTTEVLSGEDNCYDGNGDLKCKQNDQGQKVCLPKGVTSGSKACGGDDSRCSATEYCKAGYCSPRLERRARCNPKESANQCAAPFSCRISLRGYRCR